MTPISSSTICIASVAHNLLLIYRVFTSVSGTPDCATVVNPSATLVILTVYLADPTNANGPILEPLVRRHSDECGSDVTIVVNSTAFGAMREAYFQDLNTLFTTRPLADLRHALNK